MNFIVFFYSFQVNYFLLIILDQILRGLKLTCLLQNNNINSFSRLLLYSRLLLLCVLCDKLLKKL